MDKEQMKAAKKLLKESLVQLEIFCDCCESNLCYNCKTDSVKKRIKEFLEQE